MKKNDKIPKSKANSKKNNGRFIANPGIFPIFFDCMSLKQRRRIVISIHILPPKMSLKKSGISAGLDCFVLFERSEALRFQSQESQISTAPDFIFIAPFLTVATLMLQPAQYRIISSILNTYILIWTIYGTISVEFHRQF